METEDERSRRLVEGFLPNRYDVLKILIFIGVLFVAFYAGYLLKEVYVCKAWIQGQLETFDIRYQNITLWPPNLTQRTGS